MSKYWSKIEIIYCTYNFKPPAFPSSGAFFSVNTSDLVFVVAHIFRQWRRNIMARTLGRLFAGIGHIYKADDKKLHF